ncbi:MAG TPA: tetratricopeptide repeat protein [bacterium]|nr:tetratricopeptide repeat protein [bacterium]
MASFDKLTNEFEKYLGPSRAPGALVEGAILIARQEYPRLLAGPFQKELDQLALDLGDRMASGFSAQEKIQALNRYFFEDLGFRGNRENYDEPANSYWPDVMERRMGIPVSLAAVYLEVGWRLGFPLEGVNFPGHFLVGWSGSPASYIDVFAGGRILGQADLRDLTRRFVGEGQALKPEVHLKKAGTADILHRMLSNLKAIHAQAGRLERAILCADWMRLIKPEDWGSLRDRGLFLASLDRLQEAEGALAAYLEAAPRAPDYSQVWQALCLIRIRGPLHWN